MLKTNTCDADDRQGHIVVCRYGDVFSDKDNWNETSQILIACCWVVCVYVCLRMTEVGLGDICILYLSLLFTIRHLKNKYLYPGLLNIEFNLNQPRSCLVSLLECQINIQKYRFAKLFIVGKMYWIYKTHIRCHRGWFQWSMLLS